MIRVCIESPLKGDYEGNITYARVALRHAMSEGVSAFASHLLYTQVLDDQDPVQREVGIRAGLAFGDSCDERWFYLDRGWSDGMARAKKRAEELGQVTKEIRIGHSANASMITPTVGFEGS